MYSVIVVFSNWTLVEIFNFMEDYLKVKKSDIGLARIEKYKGKDGSYRESNRTIMLVKKEVLDKAVENGLDKSQPNLDFRITEYNILDKHYPKATDKENIYLHLPKEIPYEDVKIQLNDKLKIMKNFGVIKHSYNIVIPLKSRESGEHNGYGYVNFDQDDVIIRTIVKLLLQDSKLYNDRETDNHCFLKAFWVRNKSV